MEWRSFCQNPITGSRDNRSQSFVRIVTRKSEMKHISLESSQQDELNGGLIIKIQSLDHKLIINNLLIFILYIV